MREEIKRLADENGRSMNSEIIDRLNFSLEHSGIDVDALLKNLLDINRHNAQLRSMFENDRMVATSLLWHVLGYADQIPAELTIWADSMLRLLDPNTPSDDQPDAPLPEELDEEQQQQEVRTAKERYQAWVGAKIDEIYKRRELGGESSDE